LLPNKQCLNAGESGRARARSNIFAGPLYPADNLKNSLSSYFKYAAKFDLIIEQPLAT
jgi:hypothetical protein